MRNGTIKDNCVDVIGERERFCMARIVLDL